MATKLQKYFLNNKYFRQKIQNLLHLILKSARFKCSKFWYEIELFLRPSLGFVEHRYVATNFQVVTFEPDRTFVGLSVLGVVDLTTLVLITFLLETCQDVHAYEFTALHRLIGVMNIELSVTFLQPNDLAA